jgi:hypothetical protein
MAIVSSASADPASNLLLAIAWVIITSGSNFSGRLINFPFRVASNPGLR